jgi:NAD(P)H-flavin reductase
VIAKIYELGGVHSGAATSSIVWLCVFTGFLTKDMIDFSTPEWTVKSPMIIVVAYILLFVLLLISVTAYPTCRFKAHNTFECVHRWGGWFSLCIFWLELVLFSEISSQKQIQNEPLGVVMIGLPAFWLLLVSSFHVVLPWLRLRKLKVTSEKLSDRATRLHFKEAIPLFVGLRLSKTPLGEWHSFAAIPSRDGRGGSILISNAGDWTKDCIQNPREFYWIKGVPVTGVLCMARIFRKIIVVTTGAGIGPVLAVIQDTAQCGCVCHVIWSAPKPVETFGNEIIKSLKAVDGEAIIIDTWASKEKRPNLVQISYDLYKRYDAEAVFCISNPGLTKKILYGLEGRGVPAFGPVWDS